MEDPSPEEIEKERLRREGIEREVRLGSGRSVDSGISTSTKKKPVLRSPEQAQLRRATHLLRVARLRVVEKNGRKKKKKKKRNERRRKPE